MESDPSTYSSVTLMPVTSTQGPDTLFWLLYTYMHIYGHTNTQTHTRGGGRTYTHLMKTRIFRKLPAIQRAPCDTNTKTVLWRSSALTFSSLRKNWCLTQIILIHKGLAWVSINNLAVPKRSSGEWELLSENYSTFCIIRTWSQKFRIHQIKVNTPTPLFMLLDIEEKKIIYWYGLVAQNAIKCKAKTLVESLILKLMLW